MNIILTFTRLCFCGIYYHIFMRVYLCINYNDLRLYFVNKLHVCYFETMFLCIMYTRFLFVYIHETSYITSSLCLMCYCLYEPC